MSHTEYMAVQEFAEGLKGCLKDNRRACELIDLHLELKRIDFEQEANDMWLREQGRKYVRN